VPPFHELRFYIPANYVAMTDRDYCDALLYYGLTLDEPLSRIRLVP